MINVNCPKCQKEWELHPEKGRGQFSIRCKDLLTDEGCNFQFEVGIAKREVPLPVLLDSSLAPSNKSFWKRMISWNWSKNVVEDVEVFDLGEEVKELSENNLFEINITAR